MFPAQTIPQMAMGEETPVNRNFYYIMYWQIKWVLRTPDLQSLTHPSSTQHTYLLMQSKS